MFEVVWGGLIAWRFWTYCILSSLPQPTTGHFNTPNPSLFDPTLSYKSGLRGGGGGGGGGVKGGLGVLRVVWCALGCLYGPKMMQEIEFGQYALLTASLWDGPTSPKIPDIDKHKPNRTAIQCLDAK